MATWSQADINTLKAAVSSGVLTVIYEGPPKRQITYQSLEAMRSLLAEMIAQLANDAGTRRPFRFAAVSKGFK